MKLLTAERATYFWEWVQKNLNTFDDYTPFSQEAFYDFVFSPVCLSFEIGDGVGLTTLVFAPPNAWVQMVMLDWKFRPDVGERICAVAFEEGATRVTATVSDDRAAAREYVANLGFVFEGRMRKAFLRQGIKTVDAIPYHDIELWALTKEKFYGNGSGDSSRGGSSFGSGVSRIGGLPGVAGWGR